MIRLFPTHRVLALLTLIAAGITPAIASAATFNIDPVHTTVIYRIKHLQSSYSYGRFTKITGTFTYDADHLDATSFDVTLPVADIDSGDPMRDKHLQSPDFFDAKQFPDITFKSTSVKKTSDSTLDVTGDLTIHGITKSVTFPMTFVGAGPGMAGETRAGFEGSLELKRSDYGMTGWQKVVGDDVKLTISVEGINK